MTKHKKLNYKNNFHQGTYAFSVLFQTYIRPEKKKNAFISMSEEINLPVEKGKKKQENEKHQDDSGTCTR